MKNILTDFKAGIVVFLVAMPLCLGIAMASGVPPFAGILSGVIGGIIITLFSNSKYSVSGPAAGLTAIVISGIAMLGSYEAFLIALILAGIIQILLGVLKAGGIGNYIPNAVIKGMLSGIGIILILKQLPHLVGYHQGTHHFHLNDTLSHFHVQDILERFDVSVFIIGVVSILSLIIAEKEFYKQSPFLSLIPGPLLAVIFGILLGESFKGYHGMKIDSTYFVHLPKISNWDSLTSNLIFPSFNSFFHFDYLTIAFTIAIVASLETLLGIEAVDKLDVEHNHTNTNKELIAQGIGNILCGLLGGLPVTSVIVRSSANINAGAKSKLSAIFHALLLLVSVLFFSTLLSKIPNACLAAILIMTGLKLTKFGIYKKKWELGIDQFIPFFVTIIVMLFSDLLKGVVVGIALSIVFIIKDSIKYGFDTFVSNIGDKKSYTIKFPQHVTFFNKGFLTNYFDLIENHSKVVLDFSINRTINRDVMVVVEEFFSKADTRKLDIELKNYSHTNLKFNLS